MRFFAKLVFPLCVLICCIALLVGCGGKTKPLEMRTSYKNRELNILLITVDTLRADHVGCYGYMRDTTPHIDRLAQEGVRFANAITTMPTTLPAHCSIMTSKYPREHRVLKNGHVLHESFQTLAEILRDHGYKTAAFVGASVLDKAFGLNQGFDTYDDSNDECDDASLPEEKDVVHGNDDAEGSGKFQLIAEQVNQKVFDWLGHNQSSKFFLWVHYFDPHSPYNPPSGYENLFPADRGYQEWLKTKGVNPVDRNRLRMISLYDGEILYTDKQIGLLLDTLSGMGIMENTLIILTSDHGEGLWEHNWRGHGLYLYEEAVSVPLIIRFPALLYSNLTVHSQVGSIDIFPTIMDITDMTTRESLSGHSLMPYILNNDRQRERYFFIERRHYDEDQTSEDMKTLTSGEKYALRTNGCKFIYATKQDNEFYDLSRDPEELDNIVHKGKQADNFYKLLMEIKKGFEEKSIHLAPLKTLDDGVLERLKSLGYTQ